MQLQTSNSTVKVINPYSVNYLLVRTPITIGENNFQDRSIGLFTSARLRKTLKLHFKDNWPQESEMNTLRLHYCDNNNKSLVCFGCIRNTVTNINMYICHVTLLTAAAISCAVKPWKHRHFSCRNNTKKAITRGCFSHIFQWSVKKLLRKQLVANHHLSSSMASPKKNTAYNVASKFTAIVWALLITFR